MAVEKWIGVGIWQTVNERDMNKRAAMFLCGNCVKTNGKFKGISPILSVGWGLG